VIAVLFCCGFRFTYMGQLKFIKDKKVYEYSGGREEAVFAEFASKGYEGNKVVDFPKSLK